MASNSSNTAVGIDIGGTGIKAALVNVDTGDLISDRFRLDTPQPATPDAVARTVESVVGNIGYDGPAGATFPGVVMHGSVKTTANMDSSWTDVSVLDTLGPVVPHLETAINDADAAGLAEVRYGAGEGRDGLICMVTLGTGIGTALIYDGVLIPNAELGHIEINGKDAEKRASAAARERHDMSWDKWSRKVQRYLQHLEYVLWPDLFIIGGGVSKQPEKWFDRIETRTPKVIATLVNNAGIVGAALAASQAHQRRQ